MGWKTGGGGAAGEHTIPNPPHLSGRMLNYVEIKAGSNILDMGCGSEYLCAVMAHLIVCPLPPFTNSHFPHV